jgi:hypothetical protein
MSRLSKVLNILIHVFAASALILGLAFWFGCAQSLTQLHIGLGTGLVVCLWPLAGIGWKNGGHRGLVAFAAASQPLERPSTARASGPSVRALSLKR